MTCQTGPAPPYLPPFWSKLNVNRLLMFKWTNNVKPCQFFPQPHPFSIKTPSFHASGLKLLSPAWDTFRLEEFHHYGSTMWSTPLSPGDMCQPGALSLNYLMLLHQDGRLFVILGCTLNRELSGGVSHWLQVERAVMITFYEQVSINRSLWL